MIFVVGGSDSGLSPKNAVLVVTIPAGSTVTATQGTASLKPTLWTKGADSTLECAIFSIPASKFDSTTPWTVVATSGTYTASETVTVSVARQYDITLRYRHYIFKSGSGIVMKITTASTGSSWDITNKRMYVQGAGSWGGRGAQTASKIDLSNYTKIIVDGYRTSPGADSPSPASFITDQKIASVGSDNAAAIAAKDRIAYVGLPTSRGTVELDVSSYNTSHYVTIGGCYTMYIYNWWLE